MKCLFYLITPFLLVFTSCEKDALENCQDGFHLDDRVRLTQGVRLKVVEVIDGYCPCEVRCFFGGNLHVILEREDGDRSRDTLFGRRTALIGTHTVSLGEVYNRPSCGGITPVENFCFEIIAR